ncbi:hypothetical protein EMIT0P253_10224 [Pseudomonas sp. IT-P253]|uniref:hypothetical protein n=1 Tax=Pseudomonas sp. IT-P253 TaxID=3026455 RepID=UPI0039E1A6BA
MVYRVVKALYQDRRVNDALYAQAIETFNEAAVVELIGGVGLLRIGGNDPERVCGAPRHRCAIAVLGALIHGNLGAQSPSPFVAKLRSSTLVNTQAMATF